jgi:hypothetical protein
MPTVNALPGGVPYGPWGPLYRAAPGAEIPAVYYPGMTHAPGMRTGLRGFGATGARAVTLLGPFGQVDTTAGALGTMLVTAAIAAGGAALFAMAVKSKNPVRNSALLAGGLSLGTGLLTVGLAKSAAAAEPTV